MSDPKPQLRVWALGLRVECMVLRLGSEFKVQSLGVTGRGAHKAADVGLLGSPAIAGKYQDMGFGTLGPGFKARV